MRAEHGKGHLTPDRSNTNYEIDLFPANPSASARSWPASSTRRIPTAVSARCRGRAKATAAPAAQQAQVIREWAKQAGLQVSSRGRISAAIVEQYNAGR
jgi:hypothetical protein